MNFDNITVTRGKTQQNAKYRLTDDALTIQAKLPQQAFDVLRAMSHDALSVSDIAELADIKTRQSKERIVKYYIPLLLKAQLIEAA